jgi:hypothetical protein
MADRLSIDDVRRAGESRGWRLHSHDTKGKMASFVRSTVPGPQLLRDDGWWDQRVNLYYSTGTIATSLSHPVSGKTQLFRRDMTLRGVCEIFDNPRTHTGVGYYTRDQLERQGGADLDTLTVALRQSLADIDARAERLRAERAEIAAQLANAEDEQDHRNRAALEAQAQRKRAVEQEAERKEAQKQAAEIGRQRSARGRTATVVMSHTEEFLRSFTQTTTCLALGPGCFLGIQEEGRCYWSAGLPTGLYNQLNGRDPKLPRAHFVAMGADGEWFVQYRDKSYRSMGLPEELTLCLADNCKRAGLVDQVVVAGAFWYVRFSDGRHQFSLPIALADLLNERGRRVAWLSLACDNEYAEPAYYVRFTDGTSQWSGGLHDTLSDMLRGKVGQVIFGSDGEWICRYNPR